MCLLDARCWTADGCRVDVLKTKAVDLSERVRAWETASQTACPAHALGWQCAVMNDVAPMGLSQVVVGEGDSC